jgi:hypothetical protein
MYLIDGVGKMKKILIVLFFSALISCSKTEPCPKVELPPVREKTHISEDIEKRIKDTKQICNNMKQQLESLRFNPPLYLKHSSEYIRVCGVTVDK